MLTLKEQQEISEAVDMMDSQFTGDLIDKAEYYDIDEDPITMLTKVTIFDVDGAALATAEVEDYDMAMAYMEDNFDLEEYDPEEADDDAAAGASRWGHSRS